MISEEPEIRKELLAAAMESNESFVNRLKLTMKQRGISTRDLSSGSRVPLSTLNKLILEGRDLRLSTLRKIINYLSSLDLPQADMIIGIVATRPSLDNISRHQLMLNGKRITLKEYPASSIEDVISAAVNAERDHVNGLVCASIVANFIEKFVRVPIMSVKIEEPNVMESVALLVNKILKE
jgi:predicted transcriptional regulator